MKNFKNISIVILLISFIGFSCDDEKFLEEAPFSQISTQNFFQTQTDFEQAVNGCYQSLQSIFQFNIPAMEEMRSDNTTWQNGPNNSLLAWWNLDEFTMDLGNGLVSGLWTDCYRAIGRCNTVIYYLKDLEIENKDRYLAEVKFLRAFYYHYLVGYFGDIPLVTTLINSYEAAFEQDKRVPQAEVYNLILSDLNEAKVNLPKSYSSADFGRVTEGAARTLLAKVLMRLGQYTEAAVELTTVINLNEYTILEDYASVFDINNEHNDEIIFSVQFIEGTYGLHSSFQYMFLPFQIPKTYLSGFNPVNNHCGNNLPTINLLNSFENGDERKGMIDTTFTHKNGYYNGTIVPFTKKYMHPGHTVQRQTAKDFLVFRYPHVLLMLAECYVREGGGDPLPLINQVRTRAGLTELSSVTIHDIIHERRIEFHCEADRWGTLVRMHNEGDIDLFALMGAHGQEERLRTSISDAAFTKLKLLYPIPISVIILNPEVEQNPEYQ